MPATAEDWDARVTRLSRKLPPRGQAALAWLRQPSRRPLRLIAGVLLILGGLLSILPVLGLWMLPLGLALISQDVPMLKVPLEAAARWIEERWARVARRRRTADASADEAPRAASARPASPVARDPSAT